LTCPLAFADLPAAQLWQAGALAQAGQGSAGGAFGFQLTFGFVQGNYTNLD